MSTPLLSLDTNFLLSHSSSDFGIRAETLQQTKEKIETAVQHVEQQIGEKKHGFVEVLRDKTYLEQTKTVFTQLRWAKTLVVVGIGGSDLGARAVQQALEGAQPPVHVLFHGDSTDPFAITKLLQQIDLETTVFNIISKSGQTVETTVQYAYFKQLYQSKKSDWAKHFVFTTDPKEGVLRQEAAQHQIATLPIPPAVGGRFSVLTTVGLLPALAMGVNIDQLVSSGLAFADEAVLRRLSQSFAATQYQLFVQGTKLTVIMPYSIQLEEFARWFRQLWAESLGKDNTGILPIQARGPADQHSQGQFYNQGTPMQSILFVGIDERDETYPIQDVDVTEVAYLNGHSFHEIVNRELEASALALKKNGRPTATLHIHHLSAETLGQLFMFFELAVVYLAEMIGVNAFDQPGVEEGKQFMYALLGRPGFDAKRQEITTIQST